MGVSVEVCTTSVAEASIAFECGADSVEVCSWLAAGGVTPSSGLVDAVRNAVGIPVRVLVRPTPANFLYTEAEAIVLLTDTEVFGGGALGLVTGALDENGLLHGPIMEAVIRSAPESEISFHRAIDHAIDPVLVADQCISLGIGRILTSGGSTFASDGIAMIKKIIDRCGTNCEVAIAGGIGPQNVVELVERTGAREVHFSAQRTIPGVMGGAAMSSGTTGGNFLSEPDRAKVEGVLNALIKAGLR